MLSHANLITSASEVGIPDDGDAEATVLIVEDDELLRELNAEMIRELGYGVLEAANAMEALGILDREPRLNLLMTDLGLPGCIDGCRLAQEARRRRPNLKVLYASGYARNAVVGQEQFDRSVAYIEKPFSTEALAVKIVQLLGT